MCTAESLVARCAESTPTEQRLALAEDAEDLEAFDLRVRERSVPFETLLKDLKRRGRI